MDFNNIEKDIIKWRRILHENPELSFKEYKTTEFIKEKLLSFGNIEIIQPAETGLIGRLKGDNPGKVIGFRADIDALPLEEKTECDFKSKNKGIMHACGHDMHTAVLLGLARLLSENKHRIKGEVLFIFQRGEEIAPGGARELKKSGVLDKMDMIFSLHAMPGEKTGRIAVKRGTATANKDTFDIYVKGKGGHSSMPQHVKDPILIGAEIVTNLQTVAARNVDPFNTAVISTASFKSGEEYGVIPDSAHLTGAVRTFDEETRKIVKHRMKVIVENILKAYEADGEIKFFENDYKAVYNHEELCNIAEMVILKKFGKDALIRKERPESFSEDFSEYTDPAKGCMVWLGVDKDGTETPKLHNPYFSPDEKAMITGVGYFFGIAEELMM
jgi:amidohydrolase